MSIQLSGPGMSQPRFRQRNRGNSKTVRVNFKKHAPSNKALNNKIKAIQSKEELKHVDNYVVYGLSTSGTFSLLMQWPPEIQKEIEKVMILVQLQYNIESRI